MQTPELASGAPLRLFMLMTHYRSPADFTETRMKESMKILRRWMDAAIPCDDGPDVKFLECLMDDLNTPRAIALMHQWRKDDGRKLFAAMRFLGLFGGTCLPDDWRTVPRDQQINGPLEGPLTMGTA
ncbi:MAG: hypothetical protein NW215_10910 [Hyphomicrobiales bacterium]|nr:hypothetical protein [Hyphomicrobiales bacterium]